MTDWATGFDKAIKLRDAKQYSRAVELLESLLREGVEKRSHLAATHGEIGGIRLFDMNQPAVAEGHFRKAVELSPSSEVASLGLFHSLMDQRKVLEALDEMKRFLKDRQSEEYQKVLDDIAMAVDGKVTKLRR